MMFHFIKRFLSMEVAPRHRDTRSRGRLLILLASISLLLLSVSAQPAGAHFWERARDGHPWHWDRYGTTTVNFSNSCALAACDNARQDIYYRPHPVYLPLVSYHTDVTMIDGYFGATGWGGIANIISTVGGPGPEGAVFHIGHAHATLNRSYGYDGSVGGAGQGVMCQEIAHTLGLDHAGTGDCMALGYYPGGTNYFGSGPGSSVSHPTEDLKSLYQYPPTDCKSPHAHGAVCGY